MREIAEKLIQLNFSRSISSGSKNFVLGAQQHHCFRIQHHVQHVRIMMSGKKKLTPRSAIPTAIEHVSPAFVWHEYRSDSSKYSLNFCASETLRQAWPSLK